MTSSADRSADTAHVAPDVIPVERIESRILLLRGQKVLLDGDLAAFYGVETGALNRVVRRHQERFPTDFMFQLTVGEFNNLKCQIGISSYGGRRHRPLVFTEQGVAMLSGLLHSPRAIAVNVGIMRAFVRLRQMIAAHADLARQYDAQFKVVFDAIRGLMTPPAKSRTRALNGGFVKMGGRNDK